jgi:hypothetical protein
LLLIKPLQVINDFAIASVQNTERVAAPDGKKENKEREIEEREIRRSRMKESILTQQVLYYE